jgi:hypothetical protein
MALTDSERRILRAALREFDGTLASDFETLREYHPFLREDDSQVSLAQLATKLEVSLTDEE